MASREEITLHEIQALADIRYNIRRFLRASEIILRAEGLKPQQYQLLLHIKGLPEGQAATIGVLAERLQLQHHSTVELADRLALRGFIKRKRAGEDRRQVMLELTAKGDRILKEMAALHRNEMRQTGPALVNALKKVLANSPKAS